MTDQKRNPQEQKNAKQNQRNPEQKADRSAQPGNKPKDRDTQQTQKRNPDQDRNASKSNSIQFDRCDYDTKEHLLRAQFKQGANSITCCINQDVFTQLYHCAPSENELKASFNQHKSQISAALLSKMANKEWKVPNKEIHLDAKDLR